MLLALATRVLSWFAYTRNFLLSHIIRLISIALTDTVHIYGVQHNWSVFWLSSGTFQNNSKKNAANSEQMLPRPQAG